VADRWRLSWRRNLITRLEAEGAGLFGLDKGKRLVLAIAEEVVVAILLGCGAYSRCTTCRMEQPVKASPRR
jgi:ferredoxin